MSSTLVRGLGLTAATAIVIGIVIGTGVFLKARVMTCNVETPAMVILVWVAAGVLALLGALVYAELSAMLPRAGGEYVFIGTAYGPLWGFLFGWMRVFIANTGSQAALATGMAIFVNVLVGGALGTRALAVPLLESWTLRVDAVQAVAIAAIVVVTFINCANIAFGGRVASTLTALKVLLVFGLGAVAIAAGGNGWAHLGASGAAGACEGVSASARGGAAGFGAAMMAALWGYNGWNEATYVAGEVRRPGWTLPRALIGGLAVVTVLYVFVNAAYFAVLSPLEVASSSPASSFATDVVTRLFGPAASSLMAAVLAVSVFSALQVASLVGARVPYAMAEDGLFFRGLARVSSGTRVPVRALVAQAVWASVLVVSGSFDTLTDYALFAALLFVGMATASIFVFRARLPDAERPYRTWGYPAVPALFLVVTAWLLGNTIVTAPRQSLSGLALIVLGLPFYWYWARQRGPAAPASGAGAPTPGHGHEVTRTP